MRWVAAAGLLVIAAHYSTQTVWLVHHPLLIILPGLVAFMLWCAAGTTSTAAGGPSAPAGSYACRMDGCGFRAASAQKVADHEAGHGAVAVALGYTLDRIGIGDDGSGVTYLTKCMTDLPDEHAIIIYVAGSKSEELSSFWGGEVPINGSSQWSDNVRSKVLSKRIAKRTGADPQQILRQAQADAEAILRTNSSHVRHLSGRLLDALKSPDNGRHEGWIEL